MVIFYSYAILLIRDLARLRDYERSLLMNYAFHPSLLLPEVFDRLLNDKYFRRLLLALEPDGLALLKQRREVFSFFLAGRGI